MKTIAEINKEIPITHEVDVLVVGGGPAGIGAAISAARLGAKVLIVGAVQIPGWGRHQRRAQSLQPV